MDGPRNNYWLNAGVALAIGLVLSSIIFGWFFAKTKKSDDLLSGSQDEVNAAKSNEVESAQSEVVFTVPLSKSTGPVVRLFASSQAIT